MLEGSLEYRLPACDNSSTDSAYNTATVEGLDNDQVITVVHHLPIQDSNEPVSWKSDRLPLGLRPFGNVVTQRIVSRKGKPHCNTIEPIRTVLKRG